MSKAIKTIAPIAIAAAGMYYGMPTSAGWTGTTVGAGSIGTAGTSGSFFSGITGALKGNLLSKVGLGLQGVSALQSRKYAKAGAEASRAQTEATNAAEAIRNKHAQLLQKRQRLVSLRQARIRQGEIGGATAGAGLGASGTSGFSGSVGSVGTQTAANLGNINVAQDVGNQMSGLNQTAAIYGSDANTAQSKANIWTNTGVLGGTLLTNAEEIKNIFKS